MTDNNEAETAPQATPFPSFASLKTAHSELLESEPESGDDAKYFDAVEQFFNNARATGEFLSSEDERRSAQSILNYWLTVLYRADRKPQNTTLARLNSNLCPNLKDAQCPYPGPREFIEEEYKYFYGRSKQIEYILARLELESFLVLLGPSGTGKTSLVQAGLIPALRRLDREDEPDASQWYFFPVITPGTNPLRNLSVALKQMNLGPKMDAHEHYEKMRGDSGYLADMIQAHLKTPVVVVVDQFEEIFTLCYDQQLREAFVRNLMKLNYGRNKIILCATDDDFNRELNKLPALKDYKKASTVLPKLGLSELTDAIIKPADIVGLKFKEQTVKNIVQEIASEPVGLPLLQFTLLKLWEKRVGEETPDAFFTRMGSCRQILGASAESLLKELTAEQATAAQKMLARFVIVNDTGAHRLALLREDLKDIEGSGKVLEAMEKANIIRLTKATQPSDVQFELVHKSLLSNWPVMKQLVKEKERRRDRVKLMKVVFFVVCIIGAIYLGHLWNKGHEERVLQRLEQAAADKWAADSSKELTGEHPDLAFLLGLAAYNADHENVSTRGALLDILRYSPRPKVFIKPDSQMEGDVALSPDGRLLAANNKDGVIQVWDLSQRQLLPIKMHDPDATKQKDKLWYSPLAFSPDGRVLASGSTLDTGGSAVALWDVASGQRVNTLSGAGSVPLNCMIFSPDGKRIAVGDVGGDIYLWNTTEGDESHTPMRYGKRGNKLSFSPDDTVKESSSDSDDRINDLRFSPDGKLLASGFGDGTAFVLDVEKRQVRELITNCHCLEDAGAEEKEITALIFDSQGSKLFVGSTEDVVLYDAATGKPLSKLSSDQRSAHMYLSLSGDDRTLQGVDSQGGIYLWDVKDRRARLIRKTLLKLMPAAWSFSFSRDGNTLALNGENGLSAWNLASQRPLFGHEDNVNGAAFSRDGSLLASAGNDGHVILWDAASRKLRRELSYKGRAAYSVAFGHKTNLLAASSLTGSVALWNVSDEQDTGAFLEMQGDLEGEALKPSAVAFSPYDNMVVTLSTYRSDKIRVYLSAWDVTQRVPLDAPGPLPLDDVDEVTSAAFSLDGKMLALATKKGDHNIVTVWDTFSRTQIGPFLEGFEGDIVSLAVSPDGSWVAVGENQNSRAVLWNRQKGNAEPLPFEGQRGKVSSVAFSTDGKILSLSIDPEDDDDGGLGETHTVILWDIKSAQQLSSVFSGHEFAATALAFGAGSKVFAIADENRSLAIWDMDDSRAKDIICGVVNRDFTPKEQDKYRMWPKEEEEKYRKMSKEDQEKYRKQSNNTTMVNITKLCSGSAGTGSVSGH